MRVNWREEEIRLLLTYYKRMLSGDMHKAHPQVLEASKAIRDLEINKEYSSQSEKFRNPNGVALKLANFLFLDPTYEGKGMKGCSALDRKIFNEENMERNLKLVVQSFLELLPQLGEKGAGMGKNNSFNGLARELNVSYAGSNIKNPEESFANTSPVISFGLGRFTHVPWIVFTNYSQELMNGIYPVILCYTEQKKIILSYGISETNSPQEAWGEFVEGLSTIAKLIPEADKYLSSYVYSVYDYQNSIDEIEVDMIVNDLNKVIGDFHSQLQIITSPNKKLSKSSVNVNNKFPHRFETWLSSNNGGVRKPMDEESGRPLGNEILESKIHNLIRKMVKEYVRSSKSTICVLVGGPGNGKTDLMEFATDCFFEELGYDKIKGKKEIKKEFDKNNRKAIFNFKDYGLFLTQDASQRDDDSDNYLDALAQDFEDLKGAESALALICINRGILENLKNAAANPDQAVNQHKAIVEKIYELNNIDAIIQNKTVWGNEDLSDIKLYTWSMDYDSLFVPHADGDLIQRIIDKSKCTENYVEFNHDLHPAKGTLDFLTNKTNNGHLSKLLRCIEVLNGKRFTYREVFSLMAYLFGLSKREENNIQTRINQLQKLNIDDAISEFEVLYHLYQYSPSYKFFNTFFLANDHLINNCVKAFKGRDSEEVKKFFDILRLKNKLKLSAIPTFIDGGTVSYFDPLYFEQNNFEIMDDNDNCVQLKTLIDKVNYNAPLKIDEFSKILSHIDIAIIECVERIKSNLCLKKDYDKLNSQQLNSLDMFKGYLNSLLISFIKRGIVFSNFFIREKKKIEYFIDLTDPNYSYEFLEDFKNAISTNGKIRNSLATSIGQTADQVKHNVYSESDIERLKPIEERREDLPSTDQIFFRYKYNEHWKYVVITYKIYKNIILHTEAIFPACLDKNYHLWNDLKKIELSDNDSKGSDVFIENMCSVKYDRRTDRYDIISNSK
ncbi:hypothetical protein N9C25_00075 [Saprospiraceae bacterium]|nr:hypothetical protein [Saprospiraceae bacterium]